jgi:uncharacterized protein YceH (UPF0502 family)
MADLEQRVTTLEREVTALKSRVGANEADVTSIPDLIKLEFRLGNSRLARLSQEVADLKADLKDDIARLNAKVDGLPRIIAELLAERDRKR